MCVGGRAQCVAAAWSSVLSLRCPVAGSYAYLERFVYEFDGSQSLALLPNYAFSLPMARFRCEQQQRQQAAATKGHGLGPQPAAAGAASSRGCANSLTLLAQALLLHPLVLRELIAKLQGQGTAREPIWQQLLSRRLFAKVSVASFTCW